MERIEKMKRNPRGKQEELKRGEKNPSPLKKKMKGVSRAEADFKIPILHVPQ